MLYYTRIGRIIARLLLETNEFGRYLNLKAVAVREKLPDLLKDVEKRLNLLNYDSVHGTFKGMIKVIEINKINKYALVKINGNFVYFIFSNTHKIDYRFFNIDKAILIDNTGIWRDRKELSNHLQAGISKVILTAPGKDIPNIVNGITNIEDTSEKIYSAASCTTNTIVPVLKLVNDKYGIKNAHRNNTFLYK